MAGERRPCRSLEDFEAGSQSQWSGCAQWHPHTRQDTMPSWEKQGRYKLCSTLSHSVFITFASKSGPPFNNISYIFKERHSIEVPHPWESYPVKSLKGRQNKELGPSLRGFSIRSSFARRVSQPNSQSGVSLLESTLSIPRGLREFQDMK